MTDQTPENTQLFLTAAMPCPYLPGRQERKLFTHLTGRRARSLHHLLCDNGFRRSQNLIYRPACDGCAACQSVRIVAQEFVPVAALPAGAARPMPTCRWRCASRAPRPSSSRCSSATSMRAIRAAA